MAPVSLLRRNARPREWIDREVPDEEWENDHVVDGRVDNGDEDDGSEDSDIEVNEDDVSESEGGVEKDGDEDVEQGLSNVSFGALKQANEALSRKRKRDSNTNTDQEDKLAALRARLQRLKDEKSPIHTAPINSTSKTTKTTVPAANSDEEDETDSSASDSDSPPSEEEGLGKSRSSKHAPAAQSTKHQVTRKRTVIHLPKSRARDPRFDALHHNPSAQYPGTNTSKAYSFLADYQASEIAELKAALKGTKDEEDRVKLRRKVVSMENRLKSQAAKEREQEVLRQFRREERGKVEGGKKPFFLKKKDVKERALVEKFRGMKGKERERLVERRRVKEGQKEKRAMPRDRRAVG